jgi:hypothetical protein
MKEKNQILVSKLNMKTLKKIKIKEEDKNKSKTKKTLTETLFEFQCLYQISP